MEQRQETWDAFWAQTLRIDFFAGQWDAYRKAADARAEWLEAAFGLDTSRPVLSLACGEGGIELALARRGYKVTGIDVCSTYINHAREMAAQQAISATFLTADLRASKAPGNKLSPLPGGNGLVCCFDTFGLLSTDDEESLLQRMAGALAPGGVLLVDCPKREDQAASHHWWRVNDGYLLMDTRWEKTSYTLVQEPLFIGPEGRETVLRDPYDASRGEHNGLIRYIFSPEELARMVRSVGLTGEIVPHQRKGYTLVAGRQGVFEV
jgi:SAM-dependent methyltransferase